MFLRYNLLFPSAQVVNRSESKSMARPFLSYFSCERTYAVLATKQFVWGKNSKYGQGSDASPFGSGDRKDVEQIIHGKQ